MLVDQIFIEKHFFSIFTVTSVEYEWLRFFHQSLDRQIPNSLKRFAYETANFTVYFKRRDWKCQKLRETAMSRELCWCSDSCSRKLRIGIDYCESKSHAHRITVLFVEFLLRDVSPLLSFISRSWQGINARYCYWFQQLSIIKKLEKRLLDDFFSLKSNITYCVL